MAEPQDAPDTVTEALAFLRVEDNTLDFDQEGDTIRCPVCSATNPLVQEVVERVYRFEGPSDPGDEAIVLGVRCLNCGRRGTVVSAFGWAADPARFARLVNLTPPPGVDPTED
jgi:DNA-directed RNA polymerase subunit RPC12/RpoP